MCFSKENVEMGSRHRKCVQHRYSSKIRIAMRYPLVSVRTDIIKKKTCHQYQSCSITETVFPLPWVGVNSAGFSGSQQGFYVFRLVCKVTHIIDVRKEFWRPHWEKQCFSAGRSYFRCKQRSLILLTMMQIFIQLALLNTP